VDKYDRAETTIVGNGAYSSKKNVVHAFRGTKAMFLGTWEEAIGYTACYFLGLLPFMRL